MVRKRGGRAARAKPAEYKPPFPWSQWAGEGPEAYRAFLFYRDLGPQRSLDRVRQMWPKGGPKPPARTMLHTWSSKFSWPFRSDQWDAEFQRIVDERIRGVFTQQVERHMALGDGAFVIVSELLRRAVDDVRSADMKPVANPLTLLDAVQKIVEIQSRVSAEAALRLERAAGVGAPSGAREELLRRLERMAAAREKAEAAIAEQEAPRDAQAPPA